MLSVDRIFIRNGMPDYDSVTFRIRSHPEQKKLKGRFWVKLDDANKIVYGQPVPEVAPQFVLQVEFQHDLEDGWYAVKLPSGKIDHYSHSKSIVELAAASNWVIKYVGDERYNPFK